VTGPTDTNVGDIQILLAAPGVGGARSIGAGGPAREYVQ